MNGSSQSVEAIFSEALAKADAFERSTYLANACGDDTELQSRIETLLSAHEEAAGRYFDAPLFVSSASETDEAAREVSGTEIGPYQILEKIGEGGFGSVYLAEQQEPVRRRVALKIIKLGMDTRQVVARFEGERQALAMMEHGSIAKVHDAGATDTGRPYFVMELVQGDPITDYCDAHALTIAARLRLFVDVCHACQHAHQKGIIHRDLKPTNVLVTEQDSRPVPKIIDFGVAKATEQKLTEQRHVTEHCQLVGTPEYMSPEQATFDKSDVDTRSDIYSLGVMLYELIVGGTPFDTDKLQTRGYDEICRLIREHEPLTPSRRLSTLGDDATTICKHRQTQPAVLRKVLRSDLDWIVMKCLEKERERRYKTASALADDIERYLNHEPIAAHAPGAFYQLRKFVRKYRGPTVAATAVFAALSAGLILAAAALRIAVKQRDLADTLLYVSDMDSAYQAIEQGNVVRTGELLTRHEKPVRKDRRGFEWHYLWNQYQLLSSLTTLNHGGPIAALALSSDSLLAASAGYDRTIKVWNMTDLNTMVTLVGHTAEVTCLAFLADDTLVSGSWDRTVRLWNPISGAHRQLVKLSTGTDALALSKDRKTLAVGTHGGEIHLWNTSTWQPLGKLVDDRSSSRVKDVAFAPNGKALASCNWEDQTLKIWDLDSRELATEITAHDFFSVIAVAYSPDGKTLASGGIGRDVKLWDVDDPSRPKQVIRRAANDNNNVWSLAFSSNGEFLVGACWDKTVKVWDARSGHLRATLLGHLGMVTSIAISTDGSKLISGGIDHKLKIRKFDQFSPTPTRLPYYGVEETRLAFSSDGSKLVLATGSNGRASEPSGQVTLWNMNGADGSVPPSNVLLNLDAPATAVAFSPDSETLAVGVDRRHTNGSRSEIWLMNLAFGAVDRSLTGHAMRVSSVAFSPNGETLVSGSYDGTIRLWRVRDGTEVDRFDAGPGLVNAVAFSPDGTRIASAHGTWSRIGGEVKLWNVATREAIDDITGFDLPVWSVSFSPDGEFLAAASGDTTVRILNTRTGQTQILRGHPHTVYSAAYSPDGTRLATCGRDGTIKLWHVATGQEIARLRGHQMMTTIRFSPDGKTLAAACQDYTITLWRTQGSTTGPLVLQAPSLRSSPAEQTR